MGKFSKILLTSAILLAFTNIAAAHLSNEEANPPGNYDSPDCETYQHNHVTGENERGDSPVWSCEGEHWDGQSDWISKCNLHSTSTPSVSPSAWCVSVSTSSQKDYTKWDGSPSSSTLDASTTGSTNDGVKAHAGVAVLMVGRTTVGYDGCLLFGSTCNGKVDGDVAWYGEDETDKSPLAPICTQVMGPNGTTKEATNNCLAYIFQSSGLVHAQIGDDPQHPDCPPGEYDAHVDSDDQDANCKRDNTSIGVGFVLLP
ncbi:MAG TPA: hypothetical protein VNZ52_01145 [Candidatus Thermoplasmatota archaeon]|nr:hypothetical protein [Candidatus Thermoplasmatota archaeon]